MYLGPTPEEMEEMKKLEEEARLKKEAEEKAEKERKEAEEAAERKKRQEEWVICFIWFGSLRPINNFSVKQGLVFLGLY